MSRLADILDKPINWQSADRDPDLYEFLDDLQANILKGHGRFNTGNIFISFHGMAPLAVAAVVRALGHHCTSAYTQLSTNRKNPPHLDGGAVRCLFLSASGYRALGDQCTPPAGDAFAGGMESRAGQLNDPPRPTWGEAWRRGAPDAMLLIADADADKVTRDLQDAEGWLNGTGAKVIYVERGFQQSRAFRSGAPAEGVEHFGYVDGRSQPLILTEQIAAEPHEHWNPAFKPSQFLVVDPNGRRKHSAGSYFVFRKLEQDVRGFNAAETALGKAYFGAGATQKQLDRAGAMVVGRFEDGTPLLLKPEESKQAVVNDFTYSGDPDGEFCPFHAHIRKTNPRSSNPADRSPIMIRRGITYGPPRPMSADHSEFTDEDSEPRHSSGLLFMAYMASLEDQFEVTQRFWANSPTFRGNENPPAPVGEDPVIGQLAPGAMPMRDYQDGWTNGPVKSLGFAQFVHLKGGEYFFAPSLSFLRGVGLP